MSIELELRLEGEDANEETLLDLIDWLEEANLEGLTIKRKELPHHKGDMGGLCDSSTLITIISMLATLTSIAVTLINWRKNKEVKIVPTLINSDETSQNSDEIKAQIQEALAKIKGKVHEKK